MRNVVVLALQGLLPGSEYAGSFPGVAALGWTTLKLVALPPMVLLGIALAAWPAQRSRNSRA
jgi:hypothetical protein